MATQQEVWNIARLYEAGLDRDGEIDRAGLNFWVDEFDGGRKPESIAASFLQSEEFTEAYGAVESLSDEDFVGRLYRNVLGRDGEASGVEFWTDALAAGSSRGEVLADFATSRENEDATAFVREIVEVAPGDWYTPGGDTVPAEDSDAAHIPQGGSAAGLIDTPGDVDWYPVDLDASRSYEITVEGAQTRAGTLPDPALRILDDDEEEVAFDDDGGEGTDAALSFTPSDSDEHFLVVGSSQANAGSYRISIADTGPDDAIPGSPETDAGLTRAAPLTDTIDFTGDEDWVRVELSEDVRYTFVQRGAGPSASDEADPFLRLYDAKGTLVASDDDGSDLETLDSRIDFTPKESGIFHLSAGAYEDSIGDYRLSLSHAEDEGFGDAALEVGGSVIGRVDGELDEDWFRTELSEGTDYELELAAPESDLRPGLVFGDLTVRNAAGDEVASAAETTPPAAGPLTLDFTAPEDGTHFVTAGSSQTEAGVDYELTLDLA